MSQERRIAEVALATLLTLLRQFRVICKLLIFVLTGADHQAHDVVTALLIEAVFVIKGDRVSGFLIAKASQVKTLSRVDQYAVRKSGVHRDQPRDGEGIRCVFLLPEDRQPHLGGERMSHFVKQHEQHIARDEFRDLLTFL
jgi:hypothetical protein